MSLSNPESWPPLIAGLLALLSLAASIRAGRRHRLLNDLPTSKTLGVFIGLVELKGSAESEEPLVSYLAHRRCVHYRYDISEHWSRTVTYTDSEGKRKTRHESGWKTVSSDMQQQPFYLSDDTGVIRILPAGAEIESERVFDKTCGRSDPLYYGKGPRRSVRDSNHRRRFSEYAIPLHYQLYVTGRARQREDVVAAEIAEDPEAPIYLISTRSEAEVSRGLRWTFWGLGLFSLALAAGGLLVRLEGDVRPWEPTVIAGTTGGFAMAWLAGWVWMVFNSLVGLRNRVDHAWAQVFLQLKRRADLIPNLVKLIKAYVEHEKSAQETIATLRSQAHATAPGTDGADPMACRKQLAVLLEAYPELHANKLMLKLQHQLSETEERIALARAYYNDIATFYNTRQQVMPDTWIGRLAGCKPRELMQANGFKRSPLQVNLFRGSSKAPESEAPAPKKEPRPDEQAGGSGSS